VTAVTGLLAIAVTLAWWGRLDISPLLADVHIREGQLWRLVTSVLPHVNFLHLAYNLYWLWVFGALVEGAFGRLRTAGILLLLAVGSSAAQYALSEGGVGLSGVGYGLFGLVYVLDRAKDPRFTNAADHRVTALFIGWFFLCILLTKTGAWRIGNVAHGAGVVLGLLLGLAVVARPAWRPLASGVLVVALGLALGGATFFWPYVNLSANSLAYEGCLALQAGRNEAAAALFRRALKLDSGQAFCWYDLGIAYQRQGRWEEAAEAYGRAAALAPGRADYRKVLAGCKGRQAYDRQRAGDAEAAVRLYKEALQLGGQDALLWFNLGTAYTDRGQRESADEAFARAAALDPARARAHAAPQNAGAAPPSAEQR
jgi:membrane associated rhomboid family serine protease